MESTVSRIKQYIDCKGISVKKFEETVGFSNGAFASQYKNNKTIGVDKVENILTQYPDLSPDWLLTGNGPMLRSGEPAGGPEPHNMEERLFAIIREKDERIEAQARKIGQLEGRLDARYEQSEFLAGRNVKSAVPHVPVGTKPELSDNPVIPAGERVTVPQQPHK